MPNVEPGATPIAFGNWKQAYTVVTRKNPTIQVDPYSRLRIVLSSIGRHFVSSTFASSSILISVQPAPARRA
jgi:hypothetical protein